MGITITPDKDRMAAMNFEDLFSSLFDATRCSLVCLQSPRSDSLHNDNETFNPVASTSHSDELEFFRR